MGISLNTNIIPIQNKDIHINLALTLEEIEKGVRKSLRYRREDNCADCTGSRPNHSAICSMCNGTGIAKTDYIAKLDIPPGVSSGMVLSYNDKGHIYTSVKTTSGLLGFFSKKQKSTYGILHIKIGEIPHPVFKREYQDLIYDCQLSEAEAKYGKLLTIQSLAGEELKIQIPPNISKGKILRISGLGLSVLGSNEKGNLMIHIHIKSS